MGRSLTRPTLNRTFRHQRVLNKDNELVCLTPYNLDECEQLLGFRPTDENAAFAMGSPAVNVAGLVALPEQLERQRDLNTPPSLPGRVTVDLTGDAVLNSIINGRALDELPLTDLKKILSVCNFAGDQVKLPHVDMLALVRTVIKRPPQRPQSANHDALLTKVQQMIADGAYDIDTMRQAALPDGPGLKDEGWRDVSLSRLINLEVRLAAAHNCTGAIA